MGSGCHSVLLVRNTAKLSDGILSIDTFLRANTTSACLMKTQHFIQWAELTAAVYNNICGSYVAIVGRGPSVCAVGAAARPAGCLGRTPVQYHRIHILEWAVCVA